MLGHGYICTAQSQSHAAVTIQGWRSPRPSHCVENLFLTHKSLICIKQLGFTKCAYTYDMPKYQQ